MAAVEAAVAASGRMAVLAAFERGEILSRISRLLAENRDDVARTLAGEVGKTIRDALTETGIASLAYYADNNAKIFQDLKEKGRAFGMPTTLLIDRNGCDLATLAGPAEWASGDAIKFIEAALGR